MKFELIISICLFLIIILNIIREIIIENYWRNIRSTESDIKIKIKMLSNNMLEITPQDFFKIRNTRVEGRWKKFISAQYDFTGVYIIHNHTKEMYYVGQGKKVFQRVNNHFTGHGNGDVYADYKYGDEFTIKMIALENSGFNTLNDLERNAIATYNAYAKGYNKTRGNK